jgi:hypothetical protein
MFPNISPIEYLIAFGITFLAGVVLTATAGWYANQVKRNTACRFSPSHA